MDIKNDLLHALADRVHGAKEARKPTFGMRLFKRMMVLRIEGILQPNAIPLIKSR
jgi:hypothetical protein